MVTDSVTAWAAAITAARATSGAPRAAAALDPVSGNPVRTDRALTAVFGRRAHYFDSEETRKRFEAEPQRYASTEPPPVHRPRRRGGC
jgi:YHS domain-containing protein